MLLAAGLDRANVDAALSHFGSALVSPQNVVDLTAPFMGASELIPSQNKSKSFTLKAKRAEVRKPFFVHYFGFVNLAGNVKLPRYLLPFPTPGIWTMSAIFSATASTSAVE